MNWQDFHFIRPYWLLAVIPLIMIVWQRYHHQLNRGNWASVCDPQLLPHILIGDDKQQKTWAVYMIGCMGILTILALAGPTWLRLPQPVFRDQSALVIVLDLSRSMDAVDIKPSRLARAKFKIADILKRRQEGQTALIIYAGDAFTVSPLTDDTKTISAQLAILNTDLPPIQGSRTNVAIAKAVDLLQQAGMNKGHILLITDGIKTLDKIKDYHISILGIGTQDGAPIPLAKGGFQKDNNGAIVIAKIDNVSLRNMAYGGMYQDISLNDSDINALLDFFDNTLLNTQSEKQSFKIDTWHEQGPWLLLLILPLAALAFRRGYIVIIFLMIMPLPQHLHAWEWRDLWVTQDQQAQQAFEKGDMPQAAQLFDNAEWKATAQYKNAQYEEAIKSLEGLSGTEHLYNKGNALAQLQRYPEAIEAYQKALSLNPEHEDALYNKEIVEKMLKEQEQQQEKQDNQDSKEQDEQKQDEKEQKQDSQSQEEQKQDEKEQKQDSQSQEEQKSQEQKQKEQKQDEKEQKQEKTPDETQQANEQWLRKIPDDPGGLLKRKFRYQYQQRTQQHSGEQQQW